MDIKKIQDVATELADQIESDVLFYNGGIERPFDRTLIDLCKATKNRKKIALFLCTQGGDANAAYRIARCLQQQYEQFTIFINGICKSAGTLIAIGAHQIVMNDHGELGPLDVQLGKKDELWETDSGLTVLSAIRALEEKAFDLFETCFLNLKQRSGGRITLKTATDLASKLAVGTITPIIAQIDPIHVGEVSRAMNIGVEYGDRLGHASKNLKENVVRKLTNSYPSHGFVIDRKEAQELFINVREPNEKEKPLIALLGNAIREANLESPLIVYLSKAKEVKHESDNKENATGGEQAARDGSPGATRVVENDGIATLTEKLASRGGMSAS